MAIQDRYDVCVVGGGSGGIGAAVAAARMGLSVLLVEREGRLGGTSTLGGVNGWEPTVGATGVPRDIYDRLAAIPGAVGIASLVEPYSPGHPYGEWAPEPGLGYDDTLRRSGRKPAMVHSVVFELEPFHRVVLETLGDTGNCDVLLDASFVEVETRDGRVASVAIEHANERRTVSADWYIDCTDAALALAADAECETSEKPNGVTLVYRVRPTATPRVEPLPADVPDEPYPASAHIVTYPCSDRNVNMLPTMRGEEYASMPPEEARAKCERRVARHWCWLQSEHGFDAWERSWTAPMMGVRESRRIVGEYVLTEDDIRGGLSGQNHDDVVTITDHPVDVHGEGGGCVELDEPYGVPYRCLIPRGFRNLLVASRAASFSHVAASSCRLSRTMMQLGQAAGTACAIASDEGCDLPGVPPSVLRQRLREQGVQFDREPGAASA